MSMKFQNSKYNISCKISFYIFFCYKLKLFGVKRSMRHKHKYLNKIVCFNFPKILKLNTKLPPETVQ